MPRDSNIQAGINSEIHASLRRLEDADYVNNLIRDEETNILIGQANEANSNLQSQIDHLTSEVYQLHSYMEPHIYNGDLCYFQTLYAGNLQVSNGGQIGGNILFTGLTTFNMGAEFMSSATFRQSVSVQGDGALSSFTPHTVTIDGTAQANKVLATGDLSFSWVGLVEGNWSGGTYTVKSTGSQTTLDSTSITVTPSFSYDSDTHQYSISAGVTDENGNIVAYCDPVSSGTAAYEDGGGGNTEAHSHSARLQYLATVEGYPTFRKLSGDTIGTGTRTVYW